MKVGERICRALGSRSPLVLLLRTAFVLLVTSSARSVPVRIVDTRQAPTANNFDSRQACLHTRDHCEFYSHCVDSIFPCGSSGFMRSYAELRCNKIRFFTTPSSPQHNCPNCLSNSQIVSWARQHERCVQDKLFSLALQFNKSAIADPPTCLQFEARAFEEIESCYGNATVREELCSAITQSTDQDDLVKDLETVAEAFRVGPYHSGRATRGLSEAITSCNNSDISSPAESLISPAPQLRVVFCAKIESNGDHTEQDLPRLVARELDRPTEQFSFQGEDVEKRCAAALQPPIIQITEEDEDVVFILWEPDSEDTLPDNLGDCCKNYTPDLAIYFFDFQELKSDSTCGNGLREAGELCDAGVFNGAESSGCNSSCLPVERYECSTEQLVESECWMTMCGDGRRSMGEECDDGNGNDGDGCSSNCLVESPHYQCTRVYNQSSDCRFVPYGMYEPPPPSPSYSSSSAIPSPTLTPSSLTSSPTTATPRSPITGGVSSNARTPSLSLSTLSLTLSLAVLTLLIPVR